MGNDLCTDSFQHNHQTTNSQLHLVGGPGHSYRLLHMKYAPKCTVLLHTDLLPFDVTMDKSFFFFLSVFLRFSFFFEFRSAFDFRIVVKNFTNAFVHIKIAHNGNGTPAGGGGEVKPPTETVGWLSKVSSQMATNWKSITIHHINCTDTKNTFASFRSIKNDLKSAPKISKNSPLQFVTQRQRNTNESFASICWEVNLKIISHFWWINWQKAVTRCWCSSRYFVLVSITSGKKAFSPTEKKHIMKWVDTHRDKWYKYTHTLSLSVRQAAVARDFNGKSVFTVWASVPN